MVFGRLILNIDIVPVYAYSMANLITSVVQTLQGKIFGGNFNKMVFLEVDPCQNLLHDPSHDKFWTRVAAMCEQTLLEKPEA